MQSYFRGLECQVIASAILSKIVSLDSHRCPVHRVRVFEVLHSVGGGAMKTVFLLDGAYEFGLEHGVLAFCAKVHCPAFPVLPYRPRRSPSPYPSLVSRPVRVYAEPSTPRNLHLGPRDVFVRRDASCRGSRRRWLPSPERKLLREA